MKDRHGVWWSLVYLTSTIGLLCTCAEWGWRGLAIAAVTVATFVAVIGGFAWAVQGRRGGAHAASLTVAAGVALTAVTGLLAVLHLYALCLVLPLAATSPDVISLARRFFGAPGGPLSAPRSKEPRPDLAQPVVEPAGRELVEAAAPDLSSLDDAALCLAWRRTFLRLCAATSTTDSLSVVKQRQSVLDELHRRSPRGLLVWFNAGGRASGSPLPFLASCSDADPWQDLTPPDAGGAHV